MGHGTSVALSLIVLLSGCSPAATGEHHPDVESSIGVELIPPAISLGPRASRSFAVTISGTTDTRVTWAVQEGTAGGSVTPAGLYTAPSVGGTFHVVATSVAESTKSGVATVVVTTATGEVHPNPIISRNAPAFASSGTASNANATNYQIPWQSSGETPAWLAYDLSGVPASQRSSVLVFWLDDRLRDYDSRLNGANANGPAAYTIDAHAAQGGGPPPPPSDAGWVTLAAVDGNLWSSRQHLLGLGASGRAYNWIRLRITGFQSGDRCSLFLDIHDAAQGADDDFLLVGDSITEGWATHYPYAADAAGSAVPPGSLSDLIAALRPGRYPLAQAAGTVGAYSTWAKPADGSPGPFDTWLAMFPGKHVSIAFGSNEGLNAWTGSRLDDFYNSYVHMVDAILAAGKTAIVPVSIPYSAGTPIRTYGPGINAQLVAVLSRYAGNPQVIAGPDQWTWLSQNPHYLAADPHLSALGYLALRNLWAQFISSDVYATTPP